MRYNDILKESSRDIYLIDDVADFFLEVKKNCSEFLSLIDYDLLYRGIKGGSDIIKWKPSENRTPRDMNPIIQELVDNWLKDHGFSVLRSNSYFTSSSKHTASDYGEVYMIFPLNGFSYLWFHTSKDLFTASKGFFWYLEEEIGKDVILSYNETWDETNLKGKHKLFSNLYDSGEFDKEIEIAIDRFMETIQPLDKGIFLAMHHRQEILMTGEYYGINLSSLDKFFKDHTKYPYYIKKILSLSNKNEMIEYLKTNWIKENIKNKVLKSIQSIFSEKVSDTNLSSYLDSMDDFFSNIMKSNDIEKELEKNNLSKESIMSNHLDNIIEFLERYDRIFKTKYSITLKRLNDKLMTL